MSIFRRKSEKVEQVETKEEYPGYDRYDSSAEANQRREGETTQAYNERVPVVFQPLAPPVKLSYRGRPL